MSVTMDDLIARLGAVPRPEHPRPDRLRADWLNLNGVWTFAWDDEDRGRAEGWADGRDLPGRVLVPFCPESPLSGVHDEALHATCWVARSLDLPANLQGRRVLLHFGAVDTEAEVWLNGALLGRHVGGYDPFCFDVTDRLQPQDNRLTVRIHDDPRAAKPRGKQSPERTPKGCLYMRVTGLWQTVWLEAVGEAYVADWVLTAAAEGHLCLRAEVGGAAEQACRLALRMTLDGGEIMTAEAPVQDGEADLRVSVPDVQTWSPDSPTLYDLDLSLLGEGGQVLDQVTTYTGFRSVTIEGDKLLLNGEELFLISALDQGYNPEGLYTPPTDDFQKEDVLWARRHGLNNIRKHQIVAEPRFLYWCDRLGLTLWGEMADWGADIIAGHDDFWREWSACVRRDRNHPCLITWVPTNERHSPHDHDNSLAKARLYRETRALDPTRPVIDTSGYCHTDTDVCDLHVNPPDGEACRQWWEQWRQSIAATANFPAYPDRPTYDPGYQHRGQPVVFSETGNWWIRELPTSGPWENYGYGPVETVADFLALYRDFFLALMSEPDCAGFSYVQLYDVEGEVNGYLTYDRQPKTPAEDIAAIHAEGLRLRAQQRAVWDADSAPQ